jgi:hypothetical protein
MDKKNKPLVNLCRYTVKPGKEAEMERLHRAKAPFGLTQS